MRRGLKKAFTLVEILIVVVILGILAAIVIPQFTSASEEAQVSNVQTQLSTLRQQIELYRVRENGTFPGLVALSPDWGDPAGATAAAVGLRGPDYLRNAPVNPRTQTSTVAAGTAEPDAAGVVAGNPGWIYNAATGEIWANGFNETDAGTLELADTDGAPAWVAP